MAIAMQCKSPVSDRKKLLVAMTPPALQRFSLFLYQARDTNLKPVGTLVEMPPVCSAYQQHGFVEAGSSRSATFGNPTKT